MFFGEYPFSPDKQLISTSLSFLIFVLVQNNSSTKIPYKSKDFQKMKNIFT